MPKPPEIPTGFGLSPECVQRLRSAFAALAASPGEELRADLTGLPPIPAPMVRWLLLQALPDFDPRAKRLALWHTTVTGVITLAGTKLTITPAFANCQLDAVDVTDAQMRGLEVIGGSLRCLRADRMVASGTVLLRGHRPDPTYHYLLPADIETDIRITEGVLMCGASIHGNLDLRGARVGALAGPPPAVAILADGLRVDGNVLAGGGFTATGEIRLNGSTIGRDLNCAGATLTNPGGHTLSAVDAEVKGTLYLCRTLSGQPLRSEGTMRLLRMTIGGDLDASGSTFILHGWDGPPQGQTDVESLLADEMKVGGSVRLVERFTTFGQVRLVSAHIDGDLLCSDAWFEFPGESALIADGATVGGTTDFRRASSSGLLRFELATLKQGFLTENMVFDCDGAYRGWTADPPFSGNVCGLHAAGAALGGGFSWRTVTRWSAGETVPLDERERGGRTMWLSAPRAAIDALDDDETSWEHVDRIELRDTSYGRIRDLAALPGWRLTRLDREYAPWNTGIPDRMFSIRRWRLEAQVLWHTWREQFCLFYLLRCAGGGTETLAAQIQRFAPGPYLQLARAMRSAGFANGADDVLLRLERNRTRYGGHGVPALVWGWVLDLALRYGQRPFRPLWFLLAWLLASGALFKWLHDATKTHQLGAQMQPVKSPHPFQWVHFTLDSLLPFVSLGEKANFLVIPPGSWFGWLLVANALLGYVLLIFFAAGLTGLVRSGGDGS